MIIQGLFELTYQEGRAYCNSCLNTSRHLHVFLHHLDLAKERLCRVLKEQNHLTNQSGNIGYYTISCLVK